MIFTQALLPAREERICGPRAASADQGRVIVAASAARRTSGIRIDNDLLSSFRGPYSHEQLHSSSCRVKSFELREPAEADEASSPGPRLALARQALIDMYPAHSPQPILESPECSDDESHACGMEKDAASPKSSEKVAEWDTLLPAFHQISCRKQTKAKRERQRASDSSIWRRASLLFASFIALNLMALGMLQVIDEVADAVSGMWPASVQWVSHHWKSEPAGPTVEISADLRRVSCQSHNDEWRRQPLFSALHAGCTSVEADTFFRDGDLLVGHAMSALTPERTLRAIYLDPIKDCLMSRNPTAQFQEPDTPLKGVFDANPAQTLVLMIDFKNDAEAIFALLMEQLRPLRDMGFLTHSNGTAVIERPVTVVASGLASLELLNVNTYRDVFYDAPLEQFAALSSTWENESNVATQERIQATEVEDQAGTPLPLAHNNHNTYYASASFTLSIGLPFGSRLSESQLQQIREQIRGAHERGLKVRYWGLPNWPHSLRDHVRHVLMREGADALSVDDLTGTEWPNCNMSIARERTTADLCTTESV